MNTELRDALKDDLLRMRQLVTDQARLLDEMVELLDDAECDEPTDIYPGDVGHAPWVDTAETD